MLPIMIELHRTHSNNKNTFNACYIKRLESIMCIQYDTDGKPIKDTTKIERCHVYMRSEDHFQEMFTVDETIDEVQHKIEWAIEHVGAHLTIKNKQQAYQRQ